MIDVFYGESSSSSIRISEAVLNKVLGNRLKQRRKLMGLNQTELGEKLQISGQQIHKYEAGIDQLSAHKVLELCKFLHIPMDYFFDDLEGYQLAEDASEEYQPMESEENHVQKYLNVYQGLSAPQSKKFLLDFTIIIASQLKVMEKLMDNATSKTRPSRK